MKTSDQIATKPLIFPLITNEQGRPTAGIQCPHVVVTNGVAKIVEMSEPIADLKPETVTAAIERLLKRASELT
jgi:hypothetical protein